MSRPARFVMIGQAGLMLAVKGGDVTGDRYYSRPYVARRYTLPMLLAGLPILTAASYFKVQFDIADNKLLEMMMFIPIVLAASIIEPTIAYMMQDQLKFRLLALSILMVLLSLAVIYFIRTPVAGMVGILLMVLACWTFPYRIWRLATNQ